MSDGLNSMCEVYNKLVFSTKTTDDALDVAVAMVNLLPCNVKEVPLANTVCIGGTKKSFLDLLQRDSCCTVRRLEEFCQYILHKMSRLTAAVCGNDKKKCSRYVNM